VSDNKAEARKPQVKPIEPIDPPKKPPELLDPIPGILRYETVNVLSGESGAGKTRLLITWTKQWLTGGHIWKWAVPALPQIAIIGADDHAEDTRWWLEQAGVDPARVKIYQPFEDPNFKRIHQASVFQTARTPATLAALRAAILYCLAQLNLQPGALVYFDPITPLFIWGDGNKAKDVAPTLLILKELCKEKHITLIVVVHHGKQKADPKDRYARHEDRVAGSHAVIAFSTTQIWLAAPEEDETGEENGPTLVGVKPRRQKPVVIQYCTDAVGLFMDWGEKPEPLNAEEDRIVTFALLIPADTFVTLDKARIETLERQLGVKRARIYEYRREALKLGLLEANEDGAIRRIVDPQRH